MIRVDPKPEPEGFEVATRQPGSRYLQKNPAPKGAEWKNHDYWRASMNDLLSAYERICAYSCSYIAADTGFSSVEHFKNKDMYPGLAYEWANLRLVCGRLNGRKSKYEDVLDPFAIDDGWFVLDFPSLLVRPGRGLSEETLIMVESTIKRLKLNDDETCVRARAAWLEAYCKGQIDIDFLRSMSPFVYKELVRQGLVDHVIDMWATLQ